MRISDLSSDVCSSDLRGRASMPAYESLIVIAAGSLLGLAIIASVAAWCWKGWLDLKRAELGSTGKPVAHPAIGNRNDMRSEERRVGKTCVSKCRSRWAPYN